MIDNQLYVTEDGSSPEIDDGMHRSSLVLAINEDSTSDDSRVKCRQKQLGYGHTVTFFSHGKEKVKGKKNHAHVRSSTCRKRENEQATGDSNIAQDTLTLIKIAYLAASQ